MKLYEIDQQIQEILDGMSIDEETGEVSLDAEALAELQMARQDKLEGAALYIKELEALAKAIREEELALAKRRQAREKKAQRLRVWLTDALNGEKLETGRVSVSIRKGAERLIVDNAEAIHDWIRKLPRFDKPYDEYTADDWIELFRLDDISGYKIPPAVVDKAGVKKLMKEFGDIDGCHIEVGEPSLSIK